MEGSKLGYRVWAIAVFLLTTKPKGFPPLGWRTTWASRMKNAWYLAHRIRAGFEAEERVKFAGPVEIDETIMGGRAKNMPPSTGGAPTTSGSCPSSESGTGPPAASERPSWMPSAAPTSAPSCSAPASRTRWSTATRPTSSRACPATTTSTTPPGQYVTGCGVTHTNGIDWMSPQHLHRYMSEFAGRHNLRGLDTLAKMTAVVRGLDGKRRATPTSSVS